VEVSLDLRARKHQEDLETRSDHPRDHDLPHIKVQAKATVNENRLAIEALRREFQSRLEVVEARDERESRPAACACTSQPQTFNGNTSWSVLQFVAEHNLWSHREKSTYLITALKGRAADAFRQMRLRGNSSSPRGPYGNQHFAAAYRSQLTTKTQKAGESLQDIATAIEQLAHRASCTPT
jgi:hypothetical protein